MRKDLIVFMLAGVFFIGIAAAAQVAEAGPENDKLKVKVGPSSSRNRKRRSTSRAQPHRSCERESGSTSP